MRNSSQTVSIPDPTPFLFLIATASALVWAIGESSLTGTLILGAATVPFAIYLISRHFTAAAVLLIAATVMPRFFVEISGLKARPEHIAVGLMCVAMPFWWKKVKDQPLWIRADYLLVVYIVVNFVSSAFMSVDRSQTVKWAAQQMLVILPYFFLRILITNRQRLRKAIEILLAVGVIEALYGLLCFYSNRFFGTEFGMEIGQYGSIPGTYGTQLEANILGSTSAACMIMLLTLYFKERKSKFLAGAAITYAGMAVSLSRAAVLAAGVASLVVIFYYWKKKIVTAQMLTRVAATLLVVTLVLAPALVSLYNERFSTLEVSDVSADSNTTVRVVTIAVAFDNILEHPILGNGTASFQLLSTYSEMGWSDVEQAAWIGNTEVRVLHDMGIVGLVVFGLFIWYLFIPALKLAKRHATPELLGLLFAAVLYSISFQATEGTFMGFSWIHLGLIACAVSLSQNARETLPDQAAGNFH